MMVFGLYALFVMNKNEFPRPDHPPGRGHRRLPWCYGARGGGAGDEAAGELYLLVQRSKEGEDQVVQS